MQALAPYVMAVTYMKSRNFGAREGQRVFLGVERGNVVKRLALPSWLMTLAW